jgi:hypothetical protein
VEVGRCRGGRWRRADWGYEFGEWEREGEEDQGKIASGSSPSLCPSARRQEEISERG